MLAALFLEAGLAVALLQPAGPLLAVAFEAALLVVGFLAAPGVAHEPEAAGGVDLQAGPEGTKKGLTGGGFLVARVKGEGAEGKLAWMTNVEYRMPKAEDSAETMERGQKSWAG